MHRDLHINQPSCKLLFYWENIFGPLAMRLSCTIATMFALFEFVGRVPNRRSMFQKIQL